VDILKYSDDAFLDRFLAVVEAMKKKWLYAFTAEPLELVSELIGPEDLKAGRGYLTLLQSIFSHDLTYNQYRRFTGRFPKTIRMFPPNKRAWRIEEINRVTKRGFNLGCMFLDTFENDISFLDNKGLTAFVSEGLRRYDQNPEHGERFLSLRSHSAIFLRFIPILWITVKILPMPVLTDRLFTWLTKSITMPGVTTIISYTRLWPGWKQGCSNLTPVILIWKKRSMPVA